MSKLSAWAVSPRGRAMLEGITLALWAIFVASILTAVIFAMPISLRVA